MGVVVLHLDEGDAVSSLAKLPEEELTAAEEEVRRLREELNTKGEMIQKGEEIIRILTRATPDGIFSSVDGTIVKVNEQFAEMLGYTPAELAGRSLLDVVSPDSSAAR